MKKITLTLLGLLVTCCMWQTQAQTEFVQPTTGTTTLNACTDFYTGDTWVDSGGTGGDYTNNEDGTIEFCAAPGETVTIDFTAFDVEASGGAGGQCWDNLTVTGDAGGLDGSYAGDDFDLGAGLVCLDGTDGAGNPTLGPFTSAVGGCLSFFFDSDGSVPQSGWEADITVSGCPPQVITQPTAGTTTLFACGDFRDGDTYADSGGLGGDYTNNELGTIEFCAEPGETVTIDFTAFDVEASGGAGGQCWDNLTVTGDAGGLDGSYAGDDFDLGAGLVCLDGTDGAGNPTLGPFTSAVGGCLSFFFDSDGSVPQSGWEAAITTSGGCGTVIGNPPIITCPMDIMAGTDPGACEATVNFGAPTTFDIEDNPNNPVPVQTGGPVSGSLFPVGSTLITWEATDMDGNTSTCSFNVIVTDDEDPVAMCQDITLELDPVTGITMITPAMIDNGSTDNCGVDSLSLDIDTFTCADVGDNPVVLTVMDAEGNTVMCNAIVTITDTTAPVIVCEGEPIPSSDTISDTPGLAIDTDPGNVVVTSVINIAADETITDMDVDLDISHTWVGDLIITLESPAGTVVNLFNGPTLDCGEVDILATLDDDAATLMDDECNPGQVPTIDGTFMPTSPLAAFNGESTFGNWTLTVTDNFPGLDSGTLNEWGMTYGFLDVAMPLDVVLDANGMATVNAIDLISSIDEACGATVTLGSTTVGTATPGPMTGSFSGNARGYWFTAPEDMTITGLNVSDAASGGDQNVQVMRFAAPIMAFPGTSNYDALLHYSNSTPGNGFIPVNIPVTAGDIIGILGTRDVTNVNSYSQDTDIDINGSSVPIARFLTQNPIHAVEAPQGSFSTEPASPNVSMVNFTYTVGATATSIDFTCADVGENQIEVTVTDNNGNESMCTATVNVIDDIAPILVCMDFTLELGDDGTAVLDPFDLIDPSSFDACGFAVAAVDIEDFDCSDIGTPVLVTLFVNDPSMNPATCQAIVTVVDLLGPEIVCPLDQSQDPGPGNLFYTVPDYWATGEATATDNCTDPVVITSQDPAPGTLLPDGVYTVTITAEDEYGNVSTCDFELTVESILGLEDSELNNAIVMYPNPAQNQVTISNSSNILLDSAAIYDVNGKLVSQINLQDMQQEKVIDVSSLASGVYIVQIQSEQSSVTKRLIKE